MDARTQSWVISIFDMQIRGAGDGPTPQHFKWNMNKEKQYTKQQVIGHRYP